jgi:hypothetical protein
LYLEQDLGTKAIDVADELARGALQMFVGAVEGDELGSACWAFEPVAATMMVTSILWAPTSPFSAVILCPLGGAAS